MKWTELHVRLIFNFFFFPSSSSYGTAATALLRLLLYILTSNLFSSYCYNADDYYTGTKDCTNCCNVDCQYSFAKKEDINCVESDEQTCVMVTKCYPVHSLKKTAYCKGGTKESCDAATCCSTRRQLRNVMKEVDDVRMGKKEAAHGDHYYCTTNENGDFVPDGDDSLKRPDCPLPLKKLYLTFYFSIFF